eukprot:TRINITY_DN281_c2_g4_i1.p1 TRINITY_DN281_c2_g4~~TRINITY_DN281_c2_g4_i1.p1  ORF type:complete len:286 (+),score=66.43 TRINITY_DN281_c2_g4_i1:69-860(+)
MSNNAIFRDSTRATKYQNKFRLPPQFSDVLHDFTREVLRNQPTDIYEWAANYFKDKALKEDGVDTAKIDEADLGTNEMTWKLSDALYEYDDKKQGELYPHLIKRVLIESTGLTPAQAMFILSSSYVVQNTRGTIEYNKLATDRNAINQILYFQESGYEFEDPASKGEAHGLKLSEFQAELQAIFKEADPESTGHLTLPEFRKALETAPVQLTERDVNLLLIECTVNSDGYIAWEPMLADSMFNLVCLSETFTQFDEQQQQQQQ